MKPDELSARDRRLLRLCLLVLRCFRIMPMHFAWWAGGLIGFCYAHIPGRDQKRCRQHLRMAFPDQSQAWIANMSRRTFRHYGRMLLWSLATIHRSPEWLSPRMPTEGKDHCQSSYRSMLLDKKPWIVVSGHLGNWECLARVAGHFAPTTVLGRKQRYPVLEALVTQLRTEHGNHVVHQEDGPMACLREVRRGRSLATLPDQDVGRLAGAFVPFFGKPAYTPTGPATLAIMLDVPIQSLFCVARGRRWTIHFGPRWKLRDWRDDKVRSAALATALLTDYQERVMRRVPEQWVWWHKRWRHAPDDKQDALVVDKAMLQEARQRLILVDAPLES